MKEWGGERMLGNAGNCIYFKQFNDDCMFSMITNSRALDLDRCSGHPINQNPLLPLLNIHCGASFMFSSVEVLLYL